MDSSEQFVVPLSDVSESGNHLIGGKAGTLVRLARAGFPVPRGFCITANAYQRFLKEGDLQRTIHMELGRKAFETLRWEEVWDAALRIRSAFLRTAVPREVAGAIAAALTEMPVGAALAVRSSAPEEDTVTSSFAGLHESFVNVLGDEPVLDAVRAVWASLWSDAALLYRQELALDPARSTMAVLVQEMVNGGPSGLAFGRDPRAGASPTRAIIEAVPGPCRELVDGLVDPDRWVLDRSTGSLLEWRHGEREAKAPVAAVLGDDDLRRLLAMLREVESIVGSPPDVEWTGRGKRLTLLQARPITTLGEAPDDPRSWYLTLRPRRGHLANLCRRVAEDLIPKLQADGERFASEALEQQDNERLARALEERAAALERWKQTYRDEFIPFAHGVRQLAVYYNDAVRPTDPYEFVGLLKGEHLLACERNHQLADLAGHLRSSPHLLTALKRLISQLPRGIVPRKEEASLWQALATIPGGAEVIAELIPIMNRFLDVIFDDERLVAHPARLLPVLVRMAEKKPRSDGGALQRTRSPSTQVLEQRLLAAVGTRRQEEAEELLQIGRLSWRLRDDDNLLLARVESQLQRALDVACVRLREAGRLRPVDRAGPESAAVIAEALRHPDPPGIIRLPARPRGSPPKLGPAGVRPRQLVGQPAAPGLASGIARVIRNPSDLERVEPEEVLVCDAIQPMMTHLLPLVSAIVERRGGMLIHGAIIARELGIPCVNGIPDVVNILQAGDWITVDGYLGIVTVGAADFGLELGHVTSNATEPSG